MNETFYDYKIDIPYGSTGNVRVLCPMCSASRKKHHDKCLSVDVEDGVWNCFHCDWKGRLKTNNMEYKPAKTYARPKSYTPPSTLSEKVIKYFQVRGISEKTLTENKIGYGKEWMPNVEKEVGCIQFPYYIGNDLINIKYRDVEKNFKMVKDAERVLYGMNDIDDEVLVWVEGEVDRLSVCEVGIKSCVSVPDGAPSPNTKNYTSKFDFLESAKERIEKVKKHIIAVDNDEPGARLKAELIRRLGPEKCFVITWPEGCKDANDVLKNHGQEALLDCLENEKPAPVAGIFEVGDIEQDIIEAYKYGFEKGEKTGWLNVDNFYTVRQREWTVVTGIPSHGKSEWLDALMINLAHSYGWRFGICSMENFPLHRHFAKLSEKYVRLPFMASSRSDKMPESELKNAIEWAKEHFYFIAPEDEDLTVEGVLKLAKVLVYRYGISGLIIDPWNELDHSFASGDSETRYISSMLTKIRRFARNHGVHVWVVAHPTKLQKNGKGEYPVPTPYDISGSSHWRNKADNAIAIHRPNMADWKDPRVEVHVQKVRFKEIGKVGCAVLEYDYLTGRYEPYKDLM
jgi:twinkle protein